MAVRIRLTRVGATKQPSYRVVVADARSRLSENQRAFEDTLARIRETEGETSERRP